jgi:DNA-binding transcriptional regulator YiaG
MATTISAVETAEARRMACDGRGRVIRERAKLSRAEVAQDLGVHETTVAAWESGRRSPRGDAAQRYLRLLRALEATQVGDER